MADCVATNTADLKKQMMAKVKGTADKGAAEARDAPRKLVMLPRRRAASRSVVCSAHSFSFS